MPLIIACAISSASAAAAAAALAIFAILVDFFGVEWCGVDADDTAFTGDGLGSVDADVVDIVTSGKGGRAGSVSR